jgi:transposase
MSGLAEILEENQRLRERLLLAEATHAREVADLRAHVAAAVEKAELLAQQLELLRLSARGPASQRFVPDDQTALPFVAGPVTPPPRAPRPEPDDAVQPARGTSTPKRRTRDSVAHLPSRPVICRAPDDASCARCGGALAVIGQATSFRVEWVPGHFVVEDVARDKCACPSCPGEGVLTVPGPYLLDRALCGNGLLARVLVDKFADHIPLDRQTRRLAREGLEVSSNTLAAWVLAAADWLKVVAAAVLDDLLAQTYLQADDTGFPVQDAGDGTLRKGRLWALTDQDQVAYAFTPTKQGVYPTEILDGFRGDHLLVDGGSEFNKVVRDLGLERAGCWSHLRSYFYKALPHHPAEATLALGTIRDLFLLERDLRGRPPDEVRAQRGTVARPLVDGFFGWVEALSTYTRPESTLGKAVAYARNQESSMRVFLDHGELPMHNNLSELMLRQAVVGRKNWLFARSEGGAEAAATMYTLIGSCMLQGVDAHAYLVDVFGRLPDHPSSRVAELTPKAWRLERESHAPRRR